MQPYRLIGIDFGTTYSGLSWVWSERPENVSILTNWDGMNGQEDSSKVPTQILYKDGQKKWGFQVSTEEEPLRWFKLLLLDKDDMDEETRNSEHVTKARDMLTKFKKTAVDVTGDYLGLLWDHAKEEMIRREGEARVNGSPFRVVIAVPANFPPYAQSRIRQAATAAGITQPRQGGETLLHLVQEPEAAALAVMDDFKDQLVNSGEEFIVCDAGGGTVVGIIYVLQLNFTEKSEDTITYQLQDPGTMEMRECIKGEASLCGAIFLDEAFEKKLPGWIGKKKWEKVDKHSQTRFLLEEWEMKVKRKFNGKEKEWVVMAPVEMAVRRPWSFSARSQDRSVIRRNNIHLQTKDLRSVFDPKVNMIVDMVDKQASAAREKTGRWPKAVMLVGGFGSNEYLYQRLQERLRSSSEIEIRQPPKNEAWTAICRGAVLRAAYYNAFDHASPLRIMPNITSYVARHSYGIAFMEEFDPNRHTDEDKKEWIESVGAHCAMDQMDWYITKDEDIPVEHSVRRPWRQLIRSPVPRNVITVTLFRCASREPPRRKGNGVIKECDIICEVSTPFQDLPQQINSNGQVWRQINFEIEMKHRGTILEFAAYRDGRRQRPREVRYLSG